MPKVCPAQSGLVLQYAEFLTADIVIRYSNEAAKVRDISLCRALDVLLETTIKVQQKALDFSQWYTDGDE
jgi:hypothetical protein